MCRNVIYDPGTAEYVCLETGEVFGDRIVGLLPSRDLNHYSAELAQKDSRRVVRVSKMIVSYARELNVSNAALEEALRLARKAANHHFGTIRANSIALALLYIAARNADSIVLGRFCRKLNIKYRECRRLAKTCTRVAQKLNVKMKPLDPTRTIISYVNVLVDDESKRGDVIRLAREAYHAASGLIHSTREYLISACVVYAARSLGINVTFAHAARRLNLDDSCISHTYARLRNLIEKKVIKL